MALLDQYREAVDKLFAKVRDTQTENIIKAGKMIADSIEQGGCIHLASICHYMEYDLIYRGGGPIFYKRFNYDLKVERVCSERTP